MKNKQFVIDEENELTGMKFVGKHSILEKVHILFR
jgi:hypothetical protein